MITEREAKEMYETMIEETCPMVEIGNLSYSPAQVLELVDPIAFNEGLSDYIDSLIEDGEVVEGFNDDDDEEG